MFCPVFLRRHAVRIPEYFSEIAHVIVAEYICDLLDCELGICKKISGMCHAEPTDIFAERHPRRSRQNPLHLAGTVVEKCGQMGKGECCIIFLHIFNDKNRCFVHDRRMYGRNNNIFFMFPQKLDEKDRGEGGEHCIFVPVISLIFPQNPDCQIRKRRVSSGTEQQIRRIAASVEGTDEKVCKNIIIREQS